MTRDRPAGRVSSIDWLALFAFMMVPSASPFFSTLFFFFLSLCSPWALSLNRILGQSRVAASIDVDLVL